MSDPSICILVDPYRAASQGKLSLGTETFPNRPVFALSFNPTNAWKLDSKLCGLVARPMTYDETIRFRIEAPLPVLRQATVQKVSALL